MSLLKEFSNYEAPPSLAAGDAQLALKKADGTNAGVNDTDVKNDIRFNMMRNILNREGDVTSSDVQNYLERSQEINDEVDTVAFGIETDDDDTIKVYVNAEQADQFEAEMSKLLGLDGDAEAAINTLAQTFDIVDVVWPNDPEGDDENEDPDEEVNIDDDLGFDQEESSEEESEEGSEEGNDEPEKSPEDQEEDFEDGDPEPKKDDEEESEESDEEESDESSEDSETESDDESDEGELELDSNGEPIPEMDEDGEPVLDKDGNPVMKRKKKAKAKDQSTGDKDMKTEGLKLNGLAKLVESKRKEPGTYHDVRKNGFNGKVYVPGSDEDEDEFDLQNALDDKAQGADEVTYKGKKYKRTGPKNSTSKAGKWKLVKEAYQPEEGSLGSKFLDRVVVSEAAGEEMEMSDTVLKGLRNRLKKPYEKKTVELMSLAGVLGRYVDDVEGLGDGIRAGADALRRGGRLQRAFNAFYDGMKNLSSGGMVAEAKRGTMTLKRLVAVLSQFGLPASAGEENGALSTALRRTANKIDKTPETEGALVDLARALGLSTAEVNESQLDEAYPADKKFNVMFKYKDKDGKSWASHTILIKNVNDKEHAKRVFDLEQAKKYPEAKIVRVTLKEEVEELDEAFPEANDAFIEAAINMMTALGLPQANLDYRGTQTFQALRKRKMALGNAPALANRINKLAELIKAAERPGAVQEGGSASSTGKFRLDEGFGELEALVASQRKSHNIIEPAYGPAMIAHIQGNPKHKDTKLIIGVDADDEDEPLQVSIVSPWAKEKRPIEQRNFENTKEGYSDALKYANLLRSASLDKNGQVNAGWQD